MAKYLFFTGIAKWAKLDKPDDRYGYYGLDLYLDKGSMELFEESGLGLKIHKTDEGDYVRFRRDPDKLFEGMPEKPKKLIFDGKDENGKSVYVPFADRVGNGSLVTIKVEVYEGKKGTGHRLEAVAVENLVPYSDDDESDLPF